MRTGLGLGEDPVSSFLHSGGAAAAKDTFTSCNSTVVAAVNHYYLLLAQVLLPIGMRYEVIAPISPSTVLRFRSQAISYTTTILFRSRYLILNHRIQASRFTRRPQPSSSSFTSHLHSESDAMRRANPRSSALMIAQLLDIVYCNLDHHRRMGRKLKVFIVLYSSRHRLQFPISNFRSLVLHSLPRESNGFVHCLFTKKECSLYCTAPNGTHTRPALFEFCVISERRARLTKLDLELEDHSSQDSARTVGDIDPPTVVVSTVQSVVANVMQCAGVDIGYRYQETVVVTPSYCHRTVNTTTALQLFCAFIQL